jgi:hypothetical protein
MRTAQSTATAYEKFHHSFINLNFEKLQSFPAEPPMCLVSAQQNAGPYNENSLVGVPSEVNTGEQYGAGQKVNVCKFPLGSVNAWDVRTSLSSEQ